MLSLQYNRQAPCDFLISCLQNKSRMLKSGAEEGKKESEERKEVSQHVGVLLCLHRHKLLCNLLFLLYFASMESFFEWV